MINSKNNIISCVKYISRISYVTEGYVYRKLVNITTIQSYDRYSMREKMRKPFFDVDVKEETVGVYANRLARRLDSNRNEWEKLVAMCKENYKNMKPSDIALVVNSLSRARIYDTELFKLLVGPIIQKIPFFTSVHLSMVLSAYSKGKLLTPELYRIIKFEISNRMYEFNTSIEMCMIMNAISKFGDSDKAFLNKICNHMIKMFPRFQFTPQELSVIINSFVTLGYYNEQLFNTFSNKLVNHLPTCSLYDLTRILNGYIIFENNWNDIQYYCKEEMLNKIRYSSQNELTSSLFVLGSIHQTVVKSNIEMKEFVIEDIVNAIKHRSLKILGSFKASSLSYFLISFSKLPFKIECNEFIKVIDHLSRVDMDLSLVDLNNTLVAIAKIYSSINVNDTTSSNTNDTTSSNRVSNSSSTNKANTTTQSNNSKESKEVKENKNKSIDINDEMTKTIQNMMKKWSKIICKMLDNDRQELSVLIKILESYNRFNVYDDKMFNKVKNVIAINHIKELNRNNGYTLYEIFNKNKGYTKYDDFIEILKELIS